MAEDKKVVIAELDINVDLVIKKQRELTVEIENAKKIKIGPCVSISAPAASQNTTHFKNGQNKPRNKNIYYPCS